MSSKSPISFFSNGVQYRKYLTVKEWKKFDKVVDQVDGVKITAQEIICLKYEIILTDYLTKGEKIKQIIGKFNKTNLNKGLDKFDQGLKSFEKGVDDLQNELDGITKEFKEFKLK